ncbi:MAG TPA: protocatechuate 3,4-dioxygenase subunit alpha [Nocardioidaceae bacterium]|nr:protocatechuate 3,4-dioxygenase subunit alpha [Nocardioidaceae bacterium]
MTEFIYEVTDVPVSEGPTPWQTVGPFFHYALPYDEGPSVAGRSRRGAVTLHGHVYDGHGDPVPDALVEVWQADERGVFVDEPGIFAAPAPEGFRGFGRCPTDAQGHYTFTTVKPAAVGTADGADQAPHIAMSVFARGMLRRVVTRVYFDDEPEANAADPLLSSLEASRSTTLVAVSENGGYRFDVRLQGDAETVFLDVSAH